MHFVIKSGTAEVKATKTDMRLAQRFSDEFLQPLSRVTGLPIEAEVKAAKEAVIAILGYLVFDEQAEGRAKRPPADEEPKAGLDK